MTAAALLEEISDLHEVRSFEILELGANGRYRHAVAAVDSGKIDPVPGCEGLVLDVDEESRPE